MTRSDRVATLEEATASEKLGRLESLGEVGRGRLALSRTIRRERGDDTRISRPAAHAIPASDDGWVDASHHW